MSECSTVVRGAIGIKALFILVSQQIKEFSNFLLIDKLQGLWFRPKELLEGEGIVISLEAFDDGSQLYSSQVYLRHFGIGVGIALFLLVPLRLAFHLFVIIEGKNFIFGITIQKIEGRAGKLQNFRMFLLCFVFHLLPKLCQSCFVRLIDNNEIPFCVQYLSSYFCRCRFISTTKELSGCEPNHVTII